MNEFMQHQGHMTWRKVRSKGFNGIQQGWVDSEHQPKGDAGREGSRGRGEPCKSRRKRKRQLRRGEARGIGPGSLIIRVVRSGWLSSDQHGPEHGIEGKISG